MSALSCFRWPCAKGKEARLAVGLPFQKIIVIGGLLIPFALYKAFALVILPELSEGLEEIDPLEIRRGCHAHTPPLQIDRLLPYTQALAQYE